MSDFFTANLNCYKVCFAPYTTLVLTTDKNDVYFQLPPKADFITIGSKYRSMQLVKQLKSSFISENSELFLKLQC